MPSALDVEQKLLEAMDLEADRLLEKAKKEGLEPGDRINLTYYLRSVTDAAAGEIARIEKLNPEALNDVLLARLLKQAEGAVAPKPKKGRADG